MEELLEKLEREKNSHKGENGKVAVIAGSKDYAGAPAIAARAAYRSGADLVKILTSEKVADTVASYSENLLVNSYSGDYFSSQDVEKAADMVEWSDTAIIGPGMSQPEKEAVRELLEQSSTPIIIDADAIKPAVNSSVQKAVFTPHRGEKNHIEEQAGSLQDFASGKRLVAVKGRIDKLYTNESVYENEAGCAAMTVGGTGDMLTGVIAALSAQGLDIVDASRLGLYTNGRAGEMAAEEYGDGALPTDMIEYLPEVLFM